MKNYNPMTIIRQSSRSMLENFFNEQHCLECIDFQNDKLYEIQEAFKALPDTKLRKIEAILSQIFYFAKSDAFLIRVLEEAKLYDITMQERIKNFKNQYDKAFYIYLYHKQIWQENITFAPVDCLPSRHWCRSQNLPKITPLTDEDSRKKMGAQISAFFWQKQVRGKKYLIEYQKRNSSLHYYFVYLSDYVKSYEAWNDDDYSLESKNESRAISMVFAYDSHFGTLDTFNLGGVKIARILQKIFCDSILNYELVDEQLLKSAFQIDQFKYRKNQLHAIPEIGITRARIMCLDFHYATVNKKRSHRISIEEDSADDEIYNIIEHDFNSDNIPLNIVTVKFIKIHLDIVVNNEVRKMALEFTRNTCNLKGNSEELRLIGEKFIEESGIDGQPKLF